MTGLLGLSWWAPRYAWGRSGRGRRVGICINQDSQSVSRSIPTPPPPQKKQRSWSHSRTLRAQGTLCQSGRVGAIDDGLGHIVFCVDRAPAEILSGWARGRRRRGTRTQAGCSGWSRWMDHRITTGAVRCRIRGRVVSGTVHRGLTGSKRCIMAMGSGPGVLWHRVHGQIGRYIGQSIGHPSATSLSRNGAHRLHRIHEPLGVGWRGVLVVCAMWIEVRLRLMDWQRIGHFAHVQRR